MNLDKLHEYYNRHKKPSSKQPRTLDDTDLDYFWSAANTRRRALTRDEIIAYLEMRNPTRMWSLRRNYRWVQKQMKKMGLNPEDARELL